MWERLGQHIVDAFLRLGEAFLSVIPTALVLGASLVAGVAFGFALRALLRFVIRIGRIEEKQVSTVSSDLLKAAGVRASPAQLAGTVSFWAGVVVSLIVGINALEPGALRSGLSDAVAFLPRLLTSALILLIGMGLATLARRSVLIAAVNSGMPWALSGSRLVAAVILIFFIATSLEHLGLGKSILVAAFSIVGGGLVLALAIAFGLGGRLLARDYLEKRLKAKKDDDLGITHI